MEFIYTNFIECPLQFQVSDGRESIEKFEDHCVLTAGGFSGTVTHYSRIKASLIIPLETRFFQTARIELPEDFYERQHKSLKVMTAGDSSSLYRRAGWWIGDDGRPRIQSEVTGQPIRTLWQGDTRVPTGKHDYCVEYVASPSNSGLIRLYVDGSVWGEYTGSNYEGKEINRLVAGIDGAAGQNDLSISMKIWMIGLNNFDASPCSEKRKILLAARDEKIKKLEALFSARSEYAASLLDYQQALADFKECSE